MKKVLVTGGAGFIGSNLIQSLLKKDYKVYSIDNYSSGISRNKILNVNYINMDILNISDLNETFDICFHLAARTLVQESFKRVDDYFSSNVTGTLNIAKWASKNNIKLIYAGSASKHNNPRSSPYALTKFLGEEICKLYKLNFKLDIQIARFYNVYGPLERVDQINGNVIGIWRSRIQSGLPLQIVGDGEQTRDFIHVSDIVEGLIKIAESNIDINDAWELGSGNQYSINKLFSYFKNRFPEIKSEMINDQPSNFRSSILINNEVSKKLNWNPKDRLEDYINNLK
ncbi:NAD-dependent epimerase/dehydratase family protein [Flavobacteriaceae bacterium]|nr:NAD-dependent epimerase/dehydratase family protein [Flavobacteriaceae bacterium]